MTIAGLKRALPICRVNDNLYIGAFVIFGDCELTMACATELLKKAPEYDYLITAESEWAFRWHMKWLVSMATRSGCWRAKGAKLYMQNVVGVEVKSITTAAVQKLYLDGADAALMKGKRVLIVDDVISTANPPRAGSAGQPGGGEIVGRMGDSGGGRRAGAHGPHLPRKLPVFNAKGEIIG